MMIPVVILTLLAREPNAQPAQSVPKEKLDLSQLFRNKSYVAFLVFGFLFYIAAIAKPPSSPISSKG